MKLIEQQSFSFLSKVPFMLYIDRDRAIVYYINYLYFLVAAAAIFGFVALLSLNIFGSGLGNSGVDIVRKIAYSVLLVTIFAPFISLFLPPSLFSSIVTVAYSMMLGIFAIKETMEE